MATRTNMGTATLTGAAALALTAWATPARAQAAATADAGGTVSLDDLGSGDDDSSAFLAAGKVGGIASFNGLGPFVHAGVELGWVFGGTGRSIVAMLDVSYTAPSTDGKASEDFAPERIPGGKYEWELVQKQLVLQPTFLYRLTSVSESVTPYAGIGPRVYLLESVTRGSSGGRKFADTTEQSTKFGFGVPLGVELALGPGGLFAEVLLQWAPLDHTITGDTHLGGATLFLGYRALL